MELNQEENRVVDIVVCLECGADIEVNADWQEADTFTCSNCSVDLQVVNLEPLMVDFAPESENSWEDPDELEPLSLDEADKLTAGHDDVADGVEWDGQVPRRVATLRATRLRPQLHNGSGGLLDDGVTYLTPEGAARLQSELEHLQTDRLPRVTAWLSDAMSEGFEDEDITELEGARSELALIQGRIRNLESLLTTFEILVEPESNDVVQLGNLVTVAEGDHEPESYRIVGPAEADPLKGCISHVSPLGRMLMGGHAGEQVVVESPDGPIKFRIMAID
jgi:transcription elongation factor GreA